MIDYSKRRTLKKVAGLGAGSAALAVSSVAVSPGVVGGLLSETAVTTNKTNLSKSTNTDLADIEIRTRVSSVTNEIEVVLKNTGSANANITDMTPAEIHTARGKFDFNRLFDGGALNIASGESVSVPLQHFSLLNSSLQNQVISNPMESSVRSLGGIANSGSSLKQKLANSVSIITDGDSLAAVTVIA